MTGESGRCGPGDSELPGSACVEAPMKWQEAGNKLKEFIASSAVILDGSYNAAEPKSHGHQLSSMLSGELLDAATVVFDQLCSEQQLICDAVRYREVLELACLFLKTCCRCATFHCDNSEWSQRVLPAGGRLLAVGTRAVLSAIRLWQVANKFSGTENTKSLMPLFDGVSQEFCHLLDGLVQFADHILLADVNQQDCLEPVCSVLSHFAQCAHGVGTFDVKLMVAVYKFVVRVCSKHKEACCRWANVSDILTSMGLSVQNSTDAVAVDVQAAGTKVMKLLAFQVKVMCRVVEELAVADPGKLIPLTALLDASLHLQSLFPPYEENVSVSLGSNSATCLLDAIRDHLLEPARHLVAVLISKPTAAGTVCCRLMTTDRVYRLNPLKLCIKIVEAITDCPEHIRSRWMTSDADSCNILQSLLACLRQCPVELALAATWNEDSASNSPVPACMLYELLYIKLCRLIARLPAAAFPSVEQWLLQCLLSDQPYCSLLAVDIWVCLARTCFPPDVLYNHCCVLTDVHLAVADAARAAVSHALQRLLPVLPEDAQVRMLSRISTPQYVPVWPAVPAAVWSAAPHHWDAAICYMQTGLDVGAGPQRAKGVHAGISPVCLTSLLSDNVDCGVRRGKPSITAVSDLTQQRQHHRRELVACLQRQLSSAGVASSTRGLPAGQLNSSLIGLLSCCSSSQHVDTANDHDHCSIELSEILGLCLDTFEKTSSTSKVVMCHFLENIADRHVELSAEQSKVFRLISRLFTCLINSCDDGPVKLSALQAFKVFAERTPHAGIVADTTEQNDQIKDAVVQFITMEGDPEIATPGSAVAELLGRQMTDFVCNGYADNHSSAHCPNPGGESKHSVYRKRKIGDGPQSICVGPQSDADCSAATITGVLQQVVARVQSLASITQADADRIKRACQSILEACSSRLVEKD